MEGATIWDCVLNNLHDMEQHLSYNEKICFQVPLALPAFLCLVSVAIVCLTFYQKPHESFLALGLVGIGIVLYCIGGKWKNKPKEIQSKIGNYAIF